MTATLELGKQLKPAKRVQAVEWNFGDTLLPRQFGMKASDLGFSQSDIPNLIARAAGGNVEAAAKYNLAREAYLELASRDLCAINRTNPAKSDMKCFARNARGERLYWNEHGEQVPQMFSKTLTDDAGNPLEYQPVLEVRTRRGVRAGHECVSAPGTPLPVPGQWKIKVEENWDDLFPQLKWLDETPDDLTTTYNPQPGGLEAARAAHAETLNDKTGKRAELLEWLKPFLKDPICRWDGQL